MKRTLFALLACATLAAPAMADNWEVQSTYFRYFDGNRNLGDYSFYVYCSNGGSITSVTEKISDMTLAEFTAVAGTSYNFAEAGPSSLSQSTFQTTLSSDEYPVNTLWGVCVYTGNETGMFTVAEPTLAPGNVRPTIRIESTSYTYTPFKSGSPTPPAISIDEILKSATETRTNVAALVNSAADFMATTGMQQAKMAAKTAALAGKYDATPFMAMGGSSMRYNTGSHVDADGFNGALGVAKTFGATTLGLAGEYGISSYKSYVGSITGKGNSKLYGAVLLADWQGKHGWHAEGDVRLGRTSTDYSAMTALGHKHYTDHASYQGVLIGGGKEMKVSKKSEDTLDLYARYLYSHTNGSNTTATSGESMHFSGVQSHRTMVGARYNHELTDTAVVYAGAAWMHEFNGDAHAVIGGFTSPSPSLEGDSGMVEIGTTFAPCRSENILLNLNVQGWTGVQRGISGGAGCTIKF